MKCAATATASLEDWPSTCSGARPHAIVRKACVSHIQTHADFFSVFFDGDQEFERYLSNMCQDRHWGDELTLRAAVEAYGCIAHIISSEAQNWYLVYTPESSDDVEMLLPAGVKAPPKNRTPRLSYVSPIHYNSVVVSTSRVSRMPAGRGPRTRRRGGRTIFTLSRLVLRGNQKFPTLVRLTTPSPRAHRSRRATTSWTWPPASATPSRDGGAPTS